MIFPIFECTTTIKQANNHTLCFVTPCQVESCYYQIPTPCHIFVVPGVRLKIVISHTMSYFCGSWWCTFLLFTSQPRDINFFTTTQSTFELLFYFLLMHRAQGCQDWLNTAGQVLLLQIAQMCIVSCSDWLCRKHGKMKMVVMTFYIALFCIQLLQPYITGLHTMVTEKRKNVGSQTCICIATFCKSIATAMVLSQESL